MEEGERKNPPEDGILGSHTTVGNERECGASTFESYNPRFPRYVGLIPRFHIRKVAATIQLDGSNFQLLGVSI